MKLLKSIAILIMHAFAAVFLFWLNREQDEYDRRKEE